MNSDSSLSQNDLNEMKETFKERAALLLKRGGCSFVQKTLNAQKIGAKLVLITDIIDENAEDVIMIDYTNTGDQINIPSYLISQKEGDILFQAVKN